MPCCKWGGVMRWFNIWQQNSLTKKGLAALIFGGLIYCLLSPSQTYAQWPPFRFNLNPVYENNQITYALNFRNRADWTMTNVTIKIPLPEGTRFVEARTRPDTTAEFDGREITFFTATPYRGTVRDAYLVVEVTEPERTTFTTQPWISWQGDQPGDYLVDEETFDISLSALNWEAPSTSRLQLEAAATVEDNTITYFIYPQNVRGRMWDVEINVPVPAETTFLSSNASPPFTAGFDGREVSFFASELGLYEQIEPLKFQVSTENVTSPLLETHAWARWSNTGRAVGRRIVAQEETVTGNIIVNPSRSGQDVVADSQGDVPFSQYDVTSVALQDVLLPDNVLALKIIFYTAGELETEDQHLEYYFYIDDDCAAGTGRWFDYRGVDHRIEYDHQATRARIMPWDEGETSWDWQQQTRLLHQINGNTITMWVPYNLFQDSRAFCWIAETKNQSTEFNTRLPVDTIPTGSDIRITQHQVVSATTEIVQENIESLGSSPVQQVYIDQGDVWRYLPGWTEPPAGWQNIAFDDSDWFSGPTAIGYGAGEYATDLADLTYSIEKGNSPILVQQVDEQSGMILEVLPTGASNSVFMRRVFTVTDSIFPTQLALEVDYEGRFIAYLNGREVARRGIKTGSESPQVESFVGQDVNASSEIIELGGFTEILSQTNVLAIEAYSIDGDNLAINPKLTWRYDPAAINASDFVSDAATAPGTTAGPLTVSNLTGKLAVPLLQGTTYNVHVFSLPDGREIVQIPRARQPNIRFDGQRMLINRQGGGVENVYEYDFATGIEKQVSDAPQDWHPFYDWAGNRVVYGNDELTVGVDGRRHPYIFVQCGLLPPHQETQKICRDIPQLGILVPAGQTGEIWGSHPVWTINDRIVYKGCNSWAGFSDCGIYSVPAASTKGFSDGFIPRQLTDDTSDIPTDTQDNLIAFTSRRDGDWEAYLMNLDGTGIRNISNSPRAVDGLPTLSPDGQWVAFVSDRDGQWAVWVAPVLGGEPEKLFALPTQAPWGNDDLSWTNERISWGP